MPDYVEHGPVASVPGPLRCEGVTQWCFPLQADPEKLEALCRRVFFEPTGGELDLRPMTAHVLLTFGYIERIVSEHEPFKRMGWAAESQSAIWIPLARIDPGGEPHAAQELLMFTPYMWVDNPISLVSGREMYGFPKAFGWFELPAGTEAQSLALDVFGMNFERDEEPSKRRLVSVTRGERVHELADVAFSALRDVGRHLGQLVHGERDGVRLGWQFAESMVGELVHGRTKQVFLHQVRAVEDGTQTALQQVTQAAYHLTSVSGRPLEHEYRVEIAELDSDPLLAELGLESPSLTRHAFRTESAFVLEPGSVLWDAARQPAAT